SPLIYQWYFNGTNIVAATTSSLTLSNVQQPQAGNYSVRITNAFGSTLSSNALLTVLTISSNCVPTPQGLVSWWRAESNALDSADSNNGTLLNGTTFAPGLVGQAFSFDGIDDKIIIPDAANLRLTNAFTIEGW